MQKQKFNNLGGVDIEHQPFFVPSCLGGRSSMDFPFG
jgi:hypothetical protein